MGNLCCEEREVSAKGLFHPEPLSLNNGTASSPSNSPKRTLKNKLSIMLLGDCGTGKTSIVHRLLDTDMASHPPTATVEYEQTRVVADQRSWVVQLWDAPGGTLAAGGKNCSPPPYSTADIIILVYAVDSLRSFQNLAEWKKFAISQQPVEVREMTTFAVLGNKADEWHRREVSKQDVKDFCIAEGISTEDCPM